MIDDKLYKNSEESPFLNFIIALSLGAILAILLGFVYNFMIVIIPFVYINLFLSIGFGVVLGYGVKIFSRISKVRNVKQTLILAGLVGFIGFYFQWIAYFVFLASGEHSFEGYQSNFSVFYNPVVFWEFLLQLNQIGSWGMFGITFTDFPLWIIWSIETLLIIGAPILILYKHPVVPFSEDLNKWYDKYTLKNKFARISTQNDFKENLFLNVEQTINNLSYGAPFRFAEVSIFYLPDEQRQYLSVDNFYIENQGKGKKKRSSVVHLVEIDNRTARSLMDKFGSKKQFGLDY